MNVKGGRDVRRKREGKMKKIAMIMALTGLITASVSAIAINPTSNTTALTGSFLVPNSGVTITNLSILAGVAGTSTGTFTAGPGGLTQGIVISSGAVIDALLGNSPDTGFGIPGSTLINQINGSSYASYDVTIIEVTFDVDATVNSVYFDFVFASEEYPTYVGSSFNDSFGAFLNGQQVVFDNSGSAISINGPFFSGSNVILPAVSGISPGGSTPKLTTKVPVPNGSKGNVIQFVIGDVSDAALDSVAFISNFRGDPAIVLTPVTDLGSPTVPATPTETFTPTLTPTQTQTPTATQTPVPAELEIFAQAESHSISRNGQPVKIKVQVINKGGSTAKTVSVTCSLPHELKIAIVAGSEKWKANYSGTANIQECQDLEAGQSIFLELFVEPWVESTDTGMIKMLPFTVTYTDLAGKTKSDDSDDISFWIGETVVCPNVFNPKKAVGGVMKFKNLPYGALLTIYSVSGELVMQFGALNTAAAFWNGKNVQSSDVAPGVYYYIITDEKNNLHKKGKFLVTSD